MDLLTPLETICRLMVRARELEAQVPSIETDEEEDPTDSDDEFAVLEDDANEATEQEIVALLDDLGDDQVQEILALAWVGRGTYDASEWSDALEAAADPDSEDPAEQLLDMPTLAGYLDAGLAAFDLSCEGIGQID
ncbi:DUF3775 domain-containing protein [Sphingomonas nostoxanthinifaciens]|uniref:DUF3775 domain-containing protein n=1 Tax=Sphingomonas nostoxanthinifaciens TaxID=2872652 RepID=UPI001CC1D6F2|nr:DUF3775 domain-containing protein [Sphingomonas nostoxanthinifaciens]UAK25038.1 DUF3775 domain-containing protein [Sphingomonas nostoxanthinifaciens]